MIVRQRKHAAKPKRKWTPPRWLPAAVLLVVAPVAVGVVSFGIPDDPPVRNVKQATPAVMPAELKGHIVPGYGWVLDGEPEGEVWWTTADCPRGVRVPCLDNTVSQYQLPRWAGGLTP